jgi:outer membrane protein assembly factor BamB
LYRIDPATNAIRAHVPLRTPEGRPFEALEVLAAGGVVWGIGSEGALRLDPKTGEGLRLAGTPSADAETIGFALGDDALWALRSDRSIRRLDPRTGAELGRLRDAPPDTAFITAIGPDLLAAPDRDGSFARLDGTTGRVLWERNIGDRINAWNFDEDVLWLHTTTVGGSDRLTALALDTGRDIGATDLRTFGSTGLTAVGREVWVDTAAGRTVVVRR